MSVLQIMENAEINNIIKILGLQYRKNYSDPESLKSLRYGRLMIMTDQVRTLFTNERDIIIIYKRYIINDLNTV